MLGAYSGVGVSSTLQQKPKTLGMSAGRVKAVEENWLPRLVSRCREEENIHCTNEAPPPLPSILYLVSAMHGPLACL